MNTVIFKRNDIYYTTSEANYNARIQNVRAIHKCDGFGSAEEIVNY